MQRHIMMALVAALAFARLAAAAPEAFELGAQNMDERLKSVGVKSELVVIEGASHSVAGAGPQVSERATAVSREPMHRQ